MTSNFLALTLFAALFVLLGITVGHSILILKIRKEENRKRELELAILNKRASVLKKSKKISHDLEELIYKANVQMEIDNIIRRNE